MLKRSPVSNEIGDQYHLSQQSEHLIALPDRIEPAPGLESNRAGTGDKPYSSPNQLVNQYSERRIKPLEDKRPSSNQFTFQNKQSSNDLQSTERDRVPNESANSVKILD